MSEKTRPSRKRVGAIIAAVAVVAAAIAGTVIWQSVSDSSRVAPQPASNTVTAPTGDAASTAFPTPAVGSTAQVEPPDADAPVPFDEEVTTASNIVVTADDVTAVTSGTAGLPGEIQGPAVKVTMTLRNEGDAPVDTKGANVTLTYGKEPGLAAASLFDEEGVLWPDSVAPKASATAVFFFSVPADIDGDLRVIVDLLASEPDVVFVGPRP